MLVDIIHLIKHYRKLENKRIREFLKEDINQMRVDFLEELKLEAERELKNLNWYAILSDKHPNTSTDLKLKVNSSNTIITLIYINIKGSKKKVEIKYENRFLLVNELIVYDNNSNRLNSKENVFIDLKKRIEK